MVQKKVKREVNIGLPSNHANSKNTDANVAIQNPATLSNNECNQQPASEMHNTTDIMNSSMARKASYQDKELVGLGNSVKSTSSIKTQQTFTHSTSDGRLLSATNSNSKFKMTGSYKPMNSVFGQARRDKSVIILLSIVLMYLVCNFSRFFVKMFIIFSDDLGLQKHFYFCIENNRLHVPAFVIILGKCLTKQLW